MAKHDRLGVVALKLPRPELQSDAVLRRMFENEVHITLSLQHDNIVNAVDGKPNGSGAFLALEYYPTSLQEWLNSRKHVPLKRALKLIYGVMAGLEFSHSRNVLHRDVKPANIFLGAQGQAKLGDFGTSTYDNSSDKIGDSRVGTAYYMAPEMFQHSQASLQSDIYSLGVLSYELLSGERPFTGSSQDAIMTAHLTSFPRSLQHHRNDVSDALAQVISKAMARDPNKRYQDMRQFREDFVKASGYDISNTRIIPASPAVGRSSRHQSPPASKAPDDSSSDSDSKDNNDNSKRSGVMGWLFGNKKPQ